MTYCRQVASTIARTVQHIQSQIVSYHLTDYIIKVGSVVISTSWTERFVCVPWSDRFVSYTKNKIQHEVFFERHSRPRFLKSVTARIDHKATYDDSFRALGTI